MSDSWTVKTEDSFSFTPSPLTDWTRSHCFVPPPVSLLCSLLFLLILDLGKCVFVWFLFTSRYLLIQLFLFLSSFYPDPTYSSILLDLSLDSPISSFELTPSPFPISFFILFLSLCKIKCFKSSSQHQQRSRTLPWDKKPILLSLFWGVKVK